MSFDPAPAAAALHAARLAGTPAGPLDPAIAPRTEAEGVATQAALAALVGANPPGGFKIGATAKTMQDYLGLADPLAGFMAAPDLHRSGTRLPFASLRGPGVECEIGVRLAADLPPGRCDPERAAAAVGDLFAAIELVENRYGPPPAGDLKAVGTPTLIADQVFHRAAILGEPGAWRGHDLPGFAGRIVVAGETRGQGRARDLMGHPMAALAWLAGSPTAAAFGGLLAGQVVMLGSITPPVWLDGPCEVVVQFEYLPAVRLTLV